MTPTPDTLPPAAGTLAAVAFLGFAIQRALQIVDPFVDLLVDLCRARHASPTTRGTATAASEPRPAFPWGLSETDVKRSAMAAASFLLGLLFGQLVHLQVLRVAYGIDAPLADTVLTALVLSAGTEGANTVLKLFEGIKAAQHSKAEDVTVSAIPSQLTVAKGAAISLFASVSNTADQGVIWASTSTELHVDENSGRLIAPQTPGTYYVVATSKASPDKRTSVAITVTG